MLLTLLAELDAEIANTRNVLAHIPTEQFDWTPHPRSATLGKLANHLATMPIFVAAVVNGQAKRPGDVTSTPDLLAAFDTNTATGRAALASTTDDHLPAVIPSLNTTRLALLRNRVLSHMIHHRGQLTVYLRLLDAPVPGMYGPSSDEHKPLPL